MKEDARETMKRLYGEPIDIDKVWEDREAQYEADVSCPRLVEIKQPSRLTYGPVDPTHFTLKPGEIAYGAPQRALQPGQYVSFKDWPPRVKTESWGETMHVGIDLAGPEGDFEARQTFDLDADIKIVRDGE